MTESTERKPEVSDSGDLRRDVSFLGAMLGDVLREQGGKALFDIVEGSRVAARARRQDDAAAGQTLDGLLAGLEPQRASEVAQAFSAYFALVNMAERVHRIRRRRDYQKSGTPQPGSLDDVLRRLAAAGVQRHRLRSILERMLVEPVFTAHPTEAVRRTILAKEQRVARILVDFLEHTDRTPQESASFEARLREEITLMWQTSAHPGVGRTVADEVEHVLFYLVDVIYRIVPALDEAMSAAVRAAYGEADDDDLPSPFLRFGSWVGGDMDGNPNVGPDTIRRTLERQRELIIDRYVSEVRELFGHLSQSRSRVAFDRDVEERCEVYRKRMPEVAADIPSRYDDMPYRVLLWFCWARLEAVRTGGEHAYPACRRALRRPAPHRRPAFAATGASTRAWCEPCGWRSGWRRSASISRPWTSARTRPCTGRSWAPCSETRGSPAPRPTSGPRASTTSSNVNTSPRRRMSRRPRGRSRSSPKSQPPVRSTAERPIGPYIISMAQGADDALAVLWLARCAGLTDPEGSGAPRRGAALRDRGRPRPRRRDAGTAARRPALPAAPRGARRPQTGHARLLGLEQGVRARGVSRWALYRAQVALSAAAERAGVELTLFHGRGGTPSRGGSKPRAGDPRPAARRHATDACGSPSRARSSTPSTACAASR